MRFCPRCGTRFLAGEPYCPHDGSQTTELPDEGPQVDPLLGTVVDGRYRIEKRIGEGGMGIVYLATHTVLGKRLALKVLRGEVARDADVVQRFITEAQSATSIGHENIIDISDFGRLPDGTVYFTMEYLDGEALTDMIKRGGSVPVREAVHIIRQISSALGAAHSRGIIHRDLKPDNIYLVKRGGAANFVKVLDFGIAKVGGASSKLTKTGMVFGTPHYMSPEQAAGQTVDQRTDVYALGVIMYEMFVGKVPFDADTFMGILTKHMFEPPIPPSQTQQGAGNRLGALEDITLKALQKKPELRQQSMADLVLELDTVAQGGNISVGVRGGGVPPPDNLADALEPPSRTEMRLSAPQSPDGRAAPAKSKLPVLAIGAALLVLVGLIIGGVVVVLTKGDTDAETAALAQQRAATALAAAQRLAGQTQHVGGQPLPLVTFDAGIGASTLIANGNVPLAPPNGAQPDAGVAAVPPVAEQISLQTTPAGAEVYQGGALVGNTPMFLSKPSGATQLALEIRASGFRSQNVLVNATSPSILTVTLVRPTGGRPREGTPPNTNNANPNPNNVNGELADPWGT